MPPDAALFLLVVHLHLIVCFHFIVTHAGLTLLLLFHLVLCHPILIVLHFLAFSSSIIPPFSAAGMLGENAKALPIKNAATQSRFFVFILFSFPNYWLLSLNQVWWQKVPAKTSRISSR